MKVHLEARRIDRVEVTLHPDFESEADWREHAVPMRKEPTGVKVQLLPETITLVWIRCTHTGGYRWRPQTRVDGFEVLPNVTDTMDLPRRAALFDSDTQDMPQWLRQLVEQYDPASAASPLRHRGLGDLR